MRIVVLDNFFQLSCLVLPRYFTVCAESFAFLKKFIALVKYGIFAEGCQIMLFPCNFIRHFLINMFNLVDDKANFISFRIQCMKL